MDCLTEFKLCRSLALLWLKKHIDFEVCEVVISDWNYRGNKLQVFKDKFTILKGKVEEFLSNWIRNYCDSFIAKWMKISYDSLALLLKLAISYLDITMDSILLYTILAVLGSTLENLKLFSSVVAILLMVSIFFPLFMTAISIAYRRPLVILSHDIWIKWKTSTVNQYRKVVCISRIVIICFFPMIPAMIISSSEKAKEKRKALKKLGTDNDESIQRSDAEEIELITKYINETRQRKLKNRI